MPDKTVEEIKQMKIDLEAEISSMLKSFEKETGVRTGYMSIERKRPKKSKHNSPESVMPYDEYERQDIETVNIEIHFN